METTRRDVTTWFLEIARSEQVHPGRAPTAAVTIVRAEPPSPEFSRFLYTAVGGDWYWTDRLGWDYAAWQRYLDRPDVETWVAYAAGMPAGYAELARQPARSVARRSPLSVSNPDFQSIRARRRTARSSAALMR